MKGFTMIELMIVMVIISIILAIALGGIAYVLSLGSDSQYKTFETRLDQSIKEYYAENGYYPAAQCPGLGLDRMQPITSLILPPAIGSTQSYTDYSAVISDITKANAAGNFGYCSASGANPGAYILLLKTKNSEPCTDTGNNNVYVFGSGRYVAPPPFLGTHQYYDIPPDYGLAFTNFGIQCFKP